MGFTRAHIIKFLHTLGCGLLAHRQPLSPGPWSHQVDLEESLSWVSIIEKIDKKIIKALEMKYSSQLCNNFQNFNSMKFWAVILLLHQMGTHMLTTSDQWRSESKLQYYYIWRQK